MSAANRSRPAPARPSFACRNTATPPMSSAARCAICSPASCRRTSTSPPTPRRSRCAALFRRSRIIGRRFRIVHVMQGGETIEVSTFRAGKDATMRRPTSTAACCATTSSATARGRRAARLHRQRPLLRPDDRNHHRLPPRRRRPAAEDPAHDRRPAHALPRGPGAHAARGAPGGQARAWPSTRRRARRSAKWPSCSRTCRRRACSTRCSSCCSPATRVKCLRQLREEGLHHGLLPLLDVILEQPLGERFVWPCRSPEHRRAGARGKPCRPASCFATLLWHEVLADLGGTQGRRRALPARPVRGHGRGARRPGRQARHHPPHRRRHQGDLGAAAALREACRARRPTACSSSRATAPAGTSCACAPRPASCRWRCPTGGTLRRRRPGPAKACWPGKSRYPPRSAAAASASRPERNAPAAARRGRSPERQRARLRRAGRQHRRSASPPAGRLRSACALPGTRVVARSSLYRSAPVGLKNQPDFINAVVAVDTALAPKPCCDAAARHRGAPRPPRAIPTRRARSISTCCSTATRCAPSRGCPAAPAHARARLRPAAAGRDRPPP
jgi:hypothetical protein